MTQDGFKDSLQEYLIRVNNANSEASLGFQFLDFIQRTFSTLESDQADNLLPFLEEYISIEEATVAISGRIDARLGNVLIEFKVDLERDLPDAKNQLRKYISAIWNEQGTDQKYYLIASDGKNCLVFTPSLEEEEPQPVLPEYVTLRQVDEINLEEDNPKEVFIQLDRYMLYSEEIRPTAENFVNDFGPDSPIYRESIDVLNGEWENVQGTSAEVLYDEWQSYLEIVHGSQERHSTELFLRHTYLDTVVKLMAYIQYTEGTLPGDEEVHQIITGEIFERWGIQNFAEEGFFSWLIRPVAEDADKRLANSILARLRDYELTTIEEDVLKELYQNLVTQTERHDLGEYYTPDWLVDEIVSTELSGDATASVLDPTCGSGTFLFKSIHKKINSVDLDGQDILDHITKNVVGVDIHPLAVTTARVNYLLALGEKIRQKEEPITIPVYLANSIKPPSHEMSISTSQTVEVYRFQPEGIEANFEIPTAIIEGSEDLLDNILDNIKNFLDRNEEYKNSHLEAHMARRVGEDYTSLSEAEREVITANLANEIYHLKKEEKDSIWTFILKNVYKPIFLERRNFDKVLGNPPWLSYRFINQEAYQDHVRKLILEDYGLIEGDDVANFAHIEMASLFFAYSMEHYLNESGDIRFVMPRAVFNGNHLEKFREGRFLESVHFTALWDFGEVTNLFNNLTCVLSAKKSAGVSYPLDGREYTGEVTDIKAQSAEEAGLSVTGKTYFLNHLGDRTIITDREIDPEMFEGDSPYKDEIHEGATIVPRTLWFVTPQEHPKLGILPDSPLVRSSDRAKSRSKKRWKGIEINRQIESDFLFYTATGSELVYFDTLELPLVVLPVGTSGDDFYMVDENTAEAKGHTLLKDWLQEASQLWEKNKKESSDLSLLERVNYRGDLERQNPSGRYKVLQNHSGSKVHGAVVDTHDLEDPSVNGTTINVARNEKGSIPLVVDAKCYYYETNNRQEAYYLSGFLNSPSIFSLIKDMMSKGLFGRRDVHKNVWEVVIPEFDSENHLHIEISNIAESAEEEANEVLPDIISDYDEPLSPSALGRVRKRQQEEMEPTRSDLSDFCLRALEAVNPTQSSLDDH